MKQLASSLWVTSVKSLIEQLAASLSNSSMLMQIEKIKIAAI
jgi:hypothetical protein